MLDLFTLVRSNLHKCVQRTTSPRGGRTHHAPLVDLQRARWRLRDFDGFAPVDSGRHGSKPWAMSTVARCMAARTARVPCRQPAMPGSPHGSHPVRNSQYAPREGPLPQTAPLHQSVRSSQSVTAAACAADGRSAAVCLMRSARRLTLNPTGTVAGHPPSTADRRRRAHIGYFIARSACRHESRFQDHTERGYRDGRRSQQGDRQGVSVSVQPGGRSAPRVLLFFLLLYVHVHKAHVRRAVCAAHSRLSSTVPRARPRTASTLR